LPSRISLNDLMVSASETNLPSYPVNTWAVVKGWDMKRWILRARSTVCNEKNRQELHHRRLQTFPKTHKLVFFGQLVHTENGNNVLQRLVVLENFLHVRGEFVVLNTDDTGIQDTRFRVERVDSGLLMKCTD